MANRGAHPRRRAGALAILVAAGALAAPVAAGATAVRHHRAPPPVVAVGQPAPGTMTGAASVSCGDAKHCWAVGLGSGVTAAIDATADGGTRWAAQPVPANVSVLASVSCVDRRHCVAVGAAGATGVVVSTDDGGASWAVGQAPSGAAAVVAIDCVTKRLCVALATDGSTSWSARSTNQGATWTRGGALPAGVAPTGLRCPSTSVCLATGTMPTTPGHGAGVIVLSSDGGATWTNSPLPSGVGILRDVTCATGICVAVGTPSTAMTGFVPAGGQLLTSRDGGSTWQVLPVAAHDDAFGVACPEPKVCVVVGTDWIGQSDPVPSGGVVSTLDGGTTWRSATLHYVPVGLASIACPLVNQCVAAGGDLLVRVALPVKPQPPKKTTPTSGGRGGVR
jgi:photosystem II stability/assembly factor-like uncharacterized protein